MSIDELLKKTTINFPRAINLEESEKLLEYISEKLPGNINYVITYYKSFFYDEMAGKAGNSTGTLNINANIKNSKEIMAFDNMGMLSSNEDVSKLSSIEFSKTPGWSIADYRPEIQRLWDNVRNIVDAYFKEN